MTRVVVTGSGAVCAAGMSPQEILGLVACAISAVRSPRSFSKTTPS